MKKILVLILLGISSCVSEGDNLVRLKAECAFAPLVKIGNTFIPVPGVGGILNLSINAICANPELIANNEAAIRNVIEALRNSRASKRSRL